MRLRLRQRLRRLAADSERGESLVELLVAVVIMSTAVVAVVGGLGTAILMSDLHRKQAEVSEYLNGYAAWIESAVAESPTRYVECATKDTSYPVYDPGPDYDAQITAVRFWDAGTNAFTTSCAGGDSGVQRITLRVWGDRIDQTRDIVIRKPCRPTDTPPCT